MLRFCVIACVLAVASLTPVDAFAQNAPPDLDEFRDALRGERFAVDPPPAPNPEDAVPREQRVAFLQRFVQSDAPRHERDRAYRRLIRIMLTNRDRHAEEWQRRWGAFVVEQERVILAEQAAHPPVVTLCTPPADARTLDFGGVRRYCAPDFAGDGEVANDFNLVARAADLRDDQARRIASLESELILRWWRVPDQVRWSGLAREARDVGLFTEALRFCTISVEAPIYAAYPFMRDQRPDTQEPYRCAAETHFLMGDWESFLSYYEPRLTGVDTREIENLVRLCVASTRAARDTAARVCDWATESVQQRDAELRARLGQSVFDSDANYERWQRAKARYDAATTACRQNSDARCRVEPEQRRVRRG